MKFLTINNHNTVFNKRMRPLIESDFVEELYIRYVFISHRNNQQFIKNYFDKNSKSNINVRKLTAEYQDLWKYHNSVFDQSAKNKDLIWRVKILNQYEKTIDHIEIWKNKNLVNDYFLSNEQDSILPDGSLWKSADKKLLSKMIYDQGFIARTIVPLISISNDLALKYYNNFLLLAKEKKQCIINTTMVN